MKNKFLAILILASVNECFSQDSGEANRLNTTINPYESRGYLHWESEPDEYYLVTIMHKDDQNQFLEVESLKTKNSYARIDLKYTRETDYYFTVTAIDENTGVVNGNSDPIPAIDPNATIYRSAGEKKCNGKNYAYSISLQQPIPNPVPANGLIFQPGVQGFLQLNQTCQFYDQNTGIIQPFWQAIDMVNYNQLPIDHPYKQVYNNNEFRYKHRDIASLGTSFFETIQIPSSPIPYNQIRVKLIFEDQSSMIQKTGIK